MFLFIILIKLWDGLTLQNFWNEVWNRSSRDTNSFGAKHMWLQVPLDVKYNAKLQTRMQYGNKTDFKEPNCMVSKKELTTDKLPLACNSWVTVHQTLSRRGFANHHARVPKNSTYYIITHDNASVRINHLSIWRNAIRIRTSFWSVARYAIW